MSCPYFVPVEKADALVWLHPARLPLGAGWKGKCSAPGHEEVQPSDEEIVEGCNLGYASTCPRLPQVRSYDAVRFSVANEKNSQILLWFVCEADHHPAAHGKLQYDGNAGGWISPHPDPRIQKLAECYVQTYLMRRAPADLPASTDHD